ncbi:hypothetical protein DF185_07995 [Marinifilum breve]|uniref:DUF5675 domain-containing protein n=1 Tax=Marinifilum breve TaxID=2184082 RepID=A0A2V4A0P3_9BACT|nr:hypothetical protein DF185_07995 [Marinifilum breve]
MDDDLIQGFHTLELPWKENKKCVSCIPEGEYKIGLWNTQKFPNTFEIKNVPNRTNILIHKGNFNTNTLGCVLLGLDKKDLNQDGLLDITDSGEAMDHLNELIRDLISEGEDAFIKIRSN